MAYRGRRRTTDEVDLTGIRPLDAVAELVPAWTRPPWASEWEQAWERAVAGDRVRGVVVVPVRGARTAALANTSRT